MVRVVGIAQVLRVNMIHSSRFALRYSWPFASPVRQKWYMAVFDVVQVVHEFYIGRLRHY